MRFALASVCTAIQDFAGNGAARSELPADVLCGSEGKKLSFTGMFCMAAKLCFGRRLDITVRCLPT